ncbi:hypothetical protein [Streptomyces alboflavus]|uniref:Uncharacterized protein n=1 Tax=Streptomyces alboflavus TaxID=67267 RepID=A0A1Z1WHD5_9ACTN|nr:hypothetical protein [Streptomyces alboflavus]ARX85800.1 hypothetical protein SMD44_05269 [Streptomyces alboflavus]
MPASERDAQPRPHGPSTTFHAYSMSDLLASCAAASAVSTPPPAPEEPARPAPVHTDERRRDAA